MWLTRASAASDHSIFSGKFSFTISQTKAKKLITPNPIFNVTPPP